MNDSLDLRNRILKMRESNNLIATKKDSLNSNLMSKFESSINDDNQRKSKSDKDTLNDKNKETVSKSHENKLSQGFCHLKVSATLLQNFSGFSMLFSYSLK